MYQKTFQKPEILIQRWFNSRITNIGVALAKGKTPKSKNTDIFAFINCVENDQNSGKTTGAMISLKASLEDVLALKHAILLVISGQAKQARRFSIASSPFSSDTSSKKILKVKEEMVKESEERFLVLVFREGEDMELRHVLDATRALALAGYLNWLAEKGFKIVMEEGMGSDIVVQGFRKQGQEGTTQSPPKPKSVEGFNPNLLFDQ